MFVNAILYIMSEGWYSLLLLVESSFRSWVTPNQLLTRARKASYASQRDFATAVAEKLGLEISPGYAQKKGSLWESGHLIPTPEELQVISRLLDVPHKELEESFSGALPYSTVDVVGRLTRTQGQGLIAACFAGRVRPKLFEEDQKALREAITRNVWIAMFFPFPLIAASPAKHAYADDFVSNYREVWRTVVKFWKLLRSFATDAESAKVKLYRPKNTQEQNVIFPPMFHRPTLVCERVHGTTAVDLFAWTQGSEHDGFYPIKGRSIEDTPTQAQAWELYFGGVYERWNETGELPDGDGYWQLYSGQTETDGDQ
jgi:hypothetical protein